MGRRRSDLGEAAEGDGVEQLDALTAGGDQAEGPQPAERAAGRLAVDADPVGQVALADAQRDLALVGAADHADLRRELGETGRHPAGEVGAALVDVQPGGGPQPVGQHPQQLHREPGMVLDEAGEGLVGHRDDLDLADRQGRRRPGQPVDGRQLAEHLAPGLDRQQQLTAAVGAGHQLHLAREHAVDGTGLVALEEQVGPRRVATSAARPRRSRATARDRAGRDRRSIALGCRPSPCHSVPGVAPAVNSTASRRTGRAAGRTGGGAGPGHGAQHGRCRIPVKKKDKSISFFRKK